MYRPRDCSFRFVCHLKDDSLQCFKVGRDEKKKNLAEYLKGSISIFGYLMCILKAHLHYWPQLGNPIDWLITYARVSSVPIISHILIDLSRAFTFRFFKFLFSFRDSIAKNLDKNSRTELIIIQGIAICTRWTNMTWRIRMCSWSSYLQSNTEILSPVFFSSSDEWRIIFCKVWKFVWERGFFRIALRFLYYLNFFDKAKGKNDLERKLPVWDNPRERKSNESY